MMQCFPRSERWIIRIFHGEGRAHSLSPCSYFISAYPYVVSHVAAFTVFTDMKDLDAYPMRKHIYIYRLTESEVHMKNPMRRLLKGITPMSSQRSWKSLWKLGVYLKASAVALVCL